MSKNLTRKGLALSAVVALGTSLFAGAPAQAAAALNLAPNAGTSYKVLASDSFEVKVFASEFNDLANTATALRWKVTRPSVSAVADYSVSGVTSATKRVVTRDATYTSDLAVDVLSPGEISATAGRNTLTINPTTSSTDVTQIYKVQAYIETSGGVGLQVGEFASPEVSITFVAGATPTLTLDPIGVGKITGTVSYGSDFNYDQTAGSNTTIEWTKDGVVSGTSNTAVRTDGTALAVASGDTYAAAGAVYSAVAQTVRYDGDSTYAKSTAVSGSVATATAKYKTVTVTQGANLAPKYSGATTEFVVRKGTTSFDYTIALFKDSAKTIPVAAGQSVKLSITETSLAAGHVVKVNGTAVPTDSSAEVVYAITDAAGKVTVSVANTLGSDTDGISIDATSGAVTTDPYLFTWAAATLNALKETSQPIVASPGAFTRTIVRGGTVEVSYALVDQFGEKWTTANTATTYRLNLALDPAKPGSNTWSAIRSDFVNGVATATIKDESDSSIAGYRVSASVLRSQDGTSSYVADSLTALGVYLKPVSAAQTSAKISLGEAKQSTVVVSDSDGVVSYTATRSTARFSAIDRRVNLWAQNATTSADYSVRISGVVKRADGGVAAGVPVTISASNVWFSTSSTADVYVSNGSIVTVTNESGVYDVYAFSNAGGTKSVVITSGAATATQKIKWAAAAANSGAVITITAPAYTSAGRSVDVVVALTDKYGAPVASASASPLRVSVSGAGSYTTIAADSDADGLVSFKLIFGANETGVATIKATYDLENDGTIDVTKTATVTIGTAPATAGTAAVSGSTGKFYVSVTNAAAKKVVIKVAGKFVKSFTGTAAKKTVVTKSTKGSKKVTVFVGGKLVATKTVTVK